ncbi:PAS domain S-box protein [Pseudobacteroides cellulosolvens]|nr:PAS domain S-box protein [Pseudobacteroides cellulosolvens]
MEFKPQNTNCSQMADALFSIGDGVITTDLHGKITYMNPSAEKLTGWVYHEACGMGFCEVFRLINAATNEPMESPIDTVLKKGATIGLQNQSAIRTVNGNLNYVSASCSPIISDDGTVGVIVVFREITQIKRMEEKLRVERNNFKTIFESTPVGKVILDKQLTIKQINKAYLKRLGKESGVEGKTFGDGVGCPNSLEYGCGNGPECSSCAVRINSEKVFESGESIIALNHKFIVNTTGEIFWFKLDFVPIEIDEEACILLVVEDITEQKKNEEKLLKSNDYLNSILDGFPALLWRDEANKECEYVNKAWCQFTGEPYKEALKGRLERHIHHDDVERCKENYDICVENRIPYQIEYRLKRHDGIYRWVMDTGKPFYDLDGNYQGYIGVIQDITERKEYEETLADMSKFYFRIFEDFPIILWKTDKEGNITYIDNKWTKILGRPEEGRGYGWLNFIHPDDRERNLKIQKAAFAENKVFDMEFRYISSSGEYRWAHSYNRPFYNHNNEFEGYIGMGIDIQDRKIAEMGRNLYELLSKISGEIILFIDKNGNIINANQAAIKSYGYTLDELCSMNISDLRVNSEFFESQFEEASTRGISFETEHRCKDGSIFPVEVSSQGMDIDEKKIVVSIIRNISERKKVEEALRKSEEKYKHLFNSAADTVFLQAFNGDSDKNIRFIEVNDAACKSLGYTREELLCMNALDIIAQNYQNLAQDYLKVIQNQSHITVESMHVSKDGVEIPVEVSIHSFELDGEKVLLSVARDITERKKAESLIIESEKRYHSLFMNMDSGFIYCKPIFQPNGKADDFEFIEVNKAYEAIMGKSKEELVGKRLSEIFPEFMRFYLDRIACWGEIALTQKGRIETEYFSNLCSKWLTVATYSPENGYFACIITDITDEKRAKLQLKKAKEEAEYEREIAETANKTKSEFLANMSHEIRTPINGIMGMLELTMLTELNKSQKENLITAKGCAMSLLRIINDILDFSKMEAGKLTIEKIDFDIKNLLDEITKAHSVRANEKGLELLYAFSSNIPPYLVGDPNRLQQVLNNLISNAIKFTDNGDVSIEVRKKSISDDYIELQFSVTDTGIGISPEGMERLFKSFSQVDSSYTRRYGGTGLGLVISRQLVEMMSGKIWVESEAGKGSTFYFTLPFRVGSKPYEKPIISSDEKRCAKKLNILIVEDDEVNRFVLSNMLNEKGYTVDIACNGLEALKAYKESRYDLILMDIQMPEMDGVEATKHIRQLEIEAGNQRNIPIIALTAYALHGDREKFLALGMDEYISKPIVMEEMYVTIDKVMDQRDKNIETEIEVRISDDGKLIKTKNNEPAAACNDVLLEQIEKKIEEFEDVIISNDLSAIENHANKLKNLFNRIDADDLKSTAFRIELFARRGDLKEAIKYSTQIQREFETFKKSLL